MPRRGKHACVPHLPLTPTTPSAADHVEGRRNVGSSDRPTIVRRTPPPYAQASGQPRSALRRARSRTRCLGTASAAKDLTFCRHVKSASKGGRCFVCGSEHDPLHVCTQRGPADANPLFAIGNEVARSRKRRWRWCDRHTMGDCSPRQNVRHSAHLLRQRMPRLHDAPWLAILLGHLESSSAPLAVPTASELDDARGFAGVCGCAQRA